MMSYFATLAASHAGLAKAVSISSGMFLDQ